MFPQKMKQTFWADLDKINQFKQSYEFVLTPLFKKLIMMYDPLYDSLLEYNNKSLNLGDIEYYDTSDENRYMLYIP